MEVSNSEKSSARKKSVTLIVAGVFLIANASLCLFFSIVWYFWPRLGVLLFGIGGVAAALQMGTYGVLAFVLGLIGGAASLLRRYFLVASICGGLSLLPAFFVLTYSTLLLGYDAVTIRHGSVIIGYLIEFSLLTILSLAVVGVILEAISRKEFS